MLEIVWPWVFALLPLPWLLRYLLPKASLNGIASLYAPFVLQLGISDQQGAERRVRKRCIVAAMFIWILLLCAGANPQWLGEPLVLPEKGRSMMLAVDISESMRIPDLDYTGSETTRLDVVKEVAGNFLERRIGDRLGLILFGSEAYIQAPLTFDHTTVRILLNEAVIGMAGKSTAIGDAIGLAVKRLRDTPKGKAVLILITDGQNTSGMVPPRRAAELAASIGLRIHAVGVGADQLTVRGLFGPQQINPSKDLDEETLKYITETTGGLYFRAKDRMELEAIYQELDKLEPIEAGNKVVRPVTALFHWPLGSAFIFSLLWGMIAMVPRRKR
ncbi:MAG: VWA domain-containing protein [Desulfobulbaceae bacterium]|nr:VWA domain-containing protein [Desulfobulbaceae bacterium]